MSPYSLYISIYLYLSLYNYISAMDTRTLYYRWNGMRMGTGLWVHQEINYSKYLICERWRKCKHSKDIRKKLQVIWIRSRYKYQPIYSPLSLIYLNPYPILFTISRCIASFPWKYDRKWWIWWSNYVLAFGVRILFILSHYIYLSNPSQRITYFFSSHRLITIILGMMNQ